MRKREKKIQNSNTKKIQYCRAIIKYIVKRKRKGTRKNNTKIQTVFISKQTSI
jgi:hypothetical protein